MLASTGNASFFFMWADATMKSCRRFECAACCMIQPIASATHHVCGGAEVREYALNRSRARYAGDADDSDDVTVTTRISSWPDRGFSRPP